jgi:hypothetical protein
MRGCCSGLTRGRGRLELLQDLRYRRQRHHQEPEARARLDIVDDVMSLQCSARHRPSLARSLGRVHAHRTILTAAQLYLKPAALSAMTRSQLKASASRAVRSYKPASSPAMSPQGTPSEPSTDGLRE